MLVEASEIYRNVQPESTKLIDIDFDGPGLYLKKDKTILIVNPKSTVATVWHHKQPEGTLYNVYVYNAPIYDTLFGASTPIPCREDSRRD